MTSRLTLDRLLGRSAAARPEARAVVAGDVAYSYRALDLAASRMARLLLHQGAPRRVALVLPNSFEWLVACFGVSRAGATLVPLNPAFSDRELGYALGLCAVEAVICRPAMVDRIEALRGELPALSTILPIANAAALDDLLAGYSAAPIEAAGNCDSIQSILFTSGTTGRPKGAMLSHRARVLGGAFCELAFEVTSRTVLDCPVPLFHSGGMGLFMTPVIGAGATLVLPGDAGPDAARHGIERWGVNTMATVPTIIRRLLDSPGFVDAARCTNLSINYGGSPMPAPLGAQLIDTLPALRRYQCYGLTEAPQLTVLSPDDHLVAPQSAGRALPGTDVRVVDEDGRDVAPGETGRIVSSGLHLFDGYLDAPESTAAAMRGGVFQTGDLATIDERGFITIVGRPSDLIISGGLNVYAREVEDVLHLHPAVQHAAVFGVPDPDWVESVAAAVVMKPGLALNADTLAEHCRERLAPYKKPRRFWFVDALPLTPAGKVRKFELRDTLLASEGR